MGKEKVKFLVFYRSSKGGASVKAKTCWDSIEIPAGAEILKIKDLEIKKDTSIFKLEEENKKLIKEVKDLLNYKMYQEKVICYARSEVSIKKWMRILERAKEPL